MLSLLIPVYNYDVRAFVKTLHEQAIQLKISFEIRLYDDYSEDKYKSKNKVLSQLPFVTYLELDKNLGRSKIRNKLADEALYDNLLFFDCDSTINRSDFLAQYVPFLNQKLVVYGGRSYSEQPPKNKATILRWLYGKKREEVTSEKRNKKPYLSFMSNNFLVHKAAFNQVRFNENLLQYGHEDSAFSHKCKKEGIKILHINNPLEHSGLEDASTFLSKTKMAIENWQYLVDQDLINANTRLFKAYNGLKKSKMEGVFLRSYKKSKNLIVSNLKGDKPNLNFLDFYKLGELVLLNSTKG